MRFENQVIYSYPVLRPDAEDYKKGEFNVEVIPSECDPASVDRGNVKLSIRYELTEYAIARLVDEGKARVGVIVRCRETMKTWNFYVDKKGGEFIIPASNIKDEIVVNAMVIVSEDVYGFTSRNFSDDYQGFAFDLKSGDMLAYETEIEFTVGRDSFKKLDSVFEINSSDNLDAYEMDVMTEDHHVKILVSKVVYDKIQRVRGKNSAADKAVLLNSIYMTAVHVAIDYLKQNPNSDLAWANVIRNNCSSRRINLEAESAHRIAQMILRYPLGSLIERVFKEED
ncbi:hypothetical protein [Mesorhizobium sp. SP-1A]|uniref:hypothetical protein n=1 Tax=Mesorhizobium sp. SP-1A TaxID=3077840 RepID=UPI0028F74D44|nr:hypothetical protein [Mesorhizobium sp. SP-1A]